MCHSELLSLCRNGDFTDSDSHGYSKVCLIITAFHKIFMINVDEVQSNNRVGVGNTVVDFFSIFSLL